MQEHTSNHRQRIFLIQTYELEDNNYYNTAEVTRTSTNGSTICDNNLSQALPTNCEISYDMWSNNTNEYSEHRFFLLPKSQFSSGTTQPTNALFIDQISNKANIGKRENNATIPTIQGTPLTNNTCHNIKYIKHGTNVEIYVDNTLMATQDLSWIENYNDYTLSMMRWSTSGTSKMRNVKFKQL